MVSGSLPSHLSAQPAELVNLTETCKHAKDQSVTFYTDSRYSFGVVHDFGALWQQTNVITFSGTPVKHFEFISDLLTAILIPSFIAVCYCAANSGVWDSLPSLAEMQTFATAAEKALWKQN